MQGAAHGVRERNLSFAVLLLCASFTALYNTLICNRWMLDDAFITFRYAQNLADGFGAVFNPGETPVEGYSNFTWMLLLTACIRCHLDPVVCSQVLAAAFAGGTLALLAFAYRIVDGLRAATGATAAVLLASLGIFHPWIASGLESTAFGFLILLSLLLHGRSLQADAKTVVFPVLGIVCALTALTRPEGLLVAGVAGAHHLWRAVVLRDRRAWYVVGSCGVIVAAHLGWRLWYYGYPVPNTFYAKVGGSMAQVARGLVYARAFGAAHWPLLIAVCCGLPGILWRMRRTPWLGALLATALLFAIFPIVVGGDVFTAFRFYAHLAPLLCLIAAMGLRDVVRPEAPRGFCTGLLVAGQLWMAWVLPDTRAIPLRGDVVTRRGSEVGRWLYWYTADTPDVLIATNTAGTIPYYSQRQVIDMLGLNDETIGHRDMPRMGHGPVGHEKGDGAYVLSRKPDIIQFASSLGGRRPRFVGGHEIMRSPEFKRDYVYREHRLPSGDTLGLYERRDFLDGRRRTAR